MAREEGQSWRVLQQGKQAGYEVRPALNGGIQGRTMLKKTGGRGKNKGPSQSAETKVEKGREALKVIYVQWLDARGMSGWRGN